jgi:hypothetical protein
MKTPPRHAHPARSDDQNACELAGSFEEIGRYETALSWYAEVSEDGGRWDMAAATGRTALLVAQRRLQDAVSSGLNALRRMRRTSPALIGEVTRALNAHAGPATALNFCRSWLKVLATCQSDPSLWFSTAAYASQCGQFGRSLRYLGHSLELGGDQPVGDLLHDFDFAPLLRHLGTGPLTPDEALALRRPVWMTRQDLLEPVGSGMSFESIGHVPAILRGILRLHTPSMTWQPAPDTPPARLAAFASWRASVRAESLKNLKAGFDKALAFPMQSGGQFA